MKRMGKTTKMEKIHLNTLTKLEEQVLQNIISSEYMEAMGRGIIDFPVWSFAATNQNKQLAGALGSLVKKGAVVCDYDKGDNGDPKETCAITELGYEYCLKLFS